MGSIHNEHYVRHQDGSLSAAIAWNGVDTDLKSVEEIAQLFNKVKSKINTIDSDIVIEQHMVRDYSSELLTTYLDFAADNAVRCHDVSDYISNNIGRHLNQFALTNKSILILTRKKRKKPLFEIFSAKKYIECVDDMAAVLDKAVTSAVSQFEGTLLNKHQWNKFVFHSIYPRMFYEESTQLRDEYFLYEQWIKEKPQLENGCLKVRDHYVKTALLYLYPDADLLNGNIGLSRHFSLMTGVQTRLVHVLQKQDKHIVSDKSEKSSKYTASFSSDKNVERDGAKLVHESQFRAAINNDGAEVFSNAFIIVMSDLDSNRLNEIVKRLANEVQSQRGELRYSDKSQLTYFRYSLPAQGFGIPWMRVDTDSQVANMFPCQVFKQGDIDNPMMLRINQFGELVAKGYKNEQVNHSITAAATGAGKGVQKCSEILETFPLGIDWYIAEIGTSYQWTVEALGGTYLEVDPETVCINPLPPLEMADFENEKVLPSKVVIGTVESLSFILLDGEAEMSTHQAMAAQTAMKSLYTKERTVQPVLGDLIEAFSSETLFETDTQRQAASLMADNLKSFLALEEGQIFNQQTNLHIHEGIFAVNLKKVFETSPKLLKFYFVFIGLAYMQYAYKAGKPSRVLLDEMHVLVNQAPKIASMLISGIARMGRKEGAAIDLVTQEKEEIEAIEKGVINQTPYFNFLWRNAGWDDIAKRIEMPDSVLNVWKGWVDPVSTGLNYRECLSKVQGQFYNLRLTYSKELMAIASSNPDDLEAKPFIGKLTNNIEERINLLFIYREHMKQSRNHQVTQQHIVNHFREKVS